MPSSNTVAPRASRRFFMMQAGSTVLSAAAIGLMSGCESIAKSSDKSASQDVSILNVALSLEHEGIAAYQLGAESGLLQPPVLKTAVQFQDHHKAHRDALIATVKKLGGSPAEARALSEYAKSLKADTLKNQGDVLALATKLELGAANAYLGVIPSFRDSALAQVAARLAADETMHWTVLTSAQGKPLPMAALTFGA